MKLDQYMNELTTEELDSFAKRADTSVAYLRHLASGYRKAGIKSILNITSASEGNVTINDLRPDQRE